MAGKLKSGSDQSSDRRNQILAIAAKLFATGGYSATTVRDIADEAGILSGSLYHHFSSKEAIALEVLRSFLDGLITEYEEILAADLSVEETINRLIQVSFIVITEQTESVALYQNEAPFLQTQPGFEFLQDSSDRIETIWRDQLNAGQEAGVFRASLDFGILYRFIRDALWMTVRWFKPGGRYTAESLSATLLDLLHNGILVQNEASPSRS